ncbi:MAG: hypothetical protein Q9187_008045 [Circinaria calcarea]
MSTRTGFRLLQISRVARGKPNRAIGCKYQTTGAAPNTPAQSLVQRLWHSPVGVKTVHFCDFSRPAEKLSLTQNLALTATGAIWTRWCLIIKPRNVLLAAVNFFLGCVGITQVTRILLYQRSLTSSTLSQIAQEDAKDIAEATKTIASDPNGAAESALKR